MKRETGAYVTLYLALTLGVLISFIFTILEGVRIQTIRMETEGVMDIALLSSFGEYHRQLLEQYDLFYIDTTYGEGSPNIRRTEQQIQYYMNRNFEKDWETVLGGIRDLTSLHCDNVTIDSYRLASDEGGNVLKQQIVDYVKLNKGIGIAEDILNNMNLIQANGFQDQDIEGQWGEVQDKIQGLVEEKKQELPSQGEEEYEVRLDNPADHAFEAKAEGILSLALPADVSLSGTQIHPQYYLSNRNRNVGTGDFAINDGIVEKALEKAFLQDYLFEKCSYFGNTKEKAILKYQLEYLLKGTSSDMENLKQVMEDILHIREASNMAYLFSDGGKMAEAEALAVVVTTLLFSPELCEAVKLSILFAWGYAESVRDMRIILDGNKVPVIKSDHSWNTPLSQILDFTSHLGEYEIEETGMDYEAFLKMFLYLHAEEKTLYRFMDTCEMDIRVTPGNQYFQMDGCVDAIKARANVSSGFGYGNEIIRSFTYE